MKHDPNKLTRWFAFYFGVKIREICKKNNQRALSDYRRLLMRILRDHTDLTLEKIGKRLGGRNHSTIYEGIKNAEFLPEINKKYIRFCEHYNLKA